MSLSQVPIPSAVVALSAPDLRSLLAELPALYGALDMTTFPRMSLEIINRLIPAAVFSSYNEIDLRSSSARVFYEPERFAEQGEIFKPDLWKHREQHPLMQRYERGEDDGVVKISDYIPARELHALELYSEVLRPMGIEDTMSFTLHGTARLKVFYAINAPGRFAERDRAMAGLLQPHLVQAFENALAFTDARALALLSTHVISDTGEHGLILATTSGRIVHANERADAHLRAAFSGETGGEGGRSNGEILPAEIVRWLGWQEPAVERPNRPFEVSRGDRTFTFRAARADAGHWLIASRALEDALLRDSLASVHRLTPQQAIILLWLSRGKTNAEIAVILGLSERTIAKHLQNLFTRLGVENRHSAMLKAIEVFGAC